MSGQFQEHINEGRQVIEEIVKADRYWFRDLTPSKLPGGPGIYVITTDSGEILRAGKTTATLRQRIYQNHLMGNQGGNLRTQLVSAGVCSDLEEAKNWIREHCAVQFLEEDALDTMGIQINWAEHFMLAVLRPTFSD